MVAVDPQPRTMFSLMTGEILEAERVPSIVGAFFTVYKLSRLIDSPNDPQSDSCPGLNRSMQQ
jgi:hypothetical protein